jgi:hypothetical protein
MEAVQSGSLRYVVSLPQQKTRVAFDNYGSFERYVDDLRAKHIKHEIKIEYDERQRVYTATVGK